MLLSLSVKNFKSIVDATVHFSELTLLTGPNGGGKSSVFDALRRIRDFSCGWLKVADAFPLTTTTRWQQESVQEFELKLTSPLGPLEYKVVIEHNPLLRKSRVREETLSTSGSPLFQFANGEVKLFRDDSSDGPTYSFDWEQSALATVAPLPENQRLTWFRRWISRVVVVSLIPRAIAAATVGESSRLEVDGSNFVGWYRHLVQERLDRVPRFDEQVRKILAGVTGHFLAQIGPDVRSLTVMFRSSVDARPAALANTVSDNAEQAKYSLSIEELSDGQKAIFVLYWLLAMTGEDGYTLFVDEPDNFLSLRELQPWMHEVEEKCADGQSQVAFISHHPEYIDLTDITRMVWMDRSTDGATTAGPVPLGDASPLSLSERIGRGWIP